MFAAVPLSFTALVRYCMAYGAWHTAFRSEADYSAVAGWISLTALVDIPILAVSAITLIQLRGFMEAVLNDVAAVNKIWAKAKPDHALDPEAQSDYTGKMVSKMQQKNAEVAMRLSKYTGFRSRYQIYNCMPALLFWSLSANDPFKENDNTDDLKTVRQKGE